MTAWVRDVIFKLLHPFMPFVTEELWRLTARAGTGARGPARAGALAALHAASPTMTPKPRSAG